MIQRGKSGLKKHRCRVACGRAHLGQTLARVKVHLPDGVENVFSHRYHMETESVTLNDRRVYDAEMMMERCSRVVAVSATLRN